MRLFGLTLGALAVLMGTTIATAQETRAVIIANGDYDTQRDVRDAGDARALAERLDTLGFEVSTMRDRDAGQMRADAARLGGTLGGADTLIVVVAGHTVGNDRDSWVLATDAPVVNGLNVGLSGLSLAALSDVMADVDGEAVLLVGVADEAARIGGALRKIVNTVELAPEVTVFTGPIDDLMDWASDELLKPGATYAEAIRRAPRSVRAFGDLPLSVGLVPEGAGNLPDELETLLFERAELLKSDTALEDYLNRYPQGYYADEAREMLADLRKSPAEEARDAEAALNLSRTDRRAIQADLTLLGFATNGIDGLFGQGTRRAISRWQKENSRSETGFLSRTEIRLINEQANVERKKSEDADAELWADTRDADSRQGYEAYLRKYPQGLFADVARTELRKLEDRDWKDAKDADTEDTYRAFLKSWPNGTHAAEARAAIDASQDTVDVAQARREEQELMANPITRLLAERRLSDLGFRPGVVDGGFDEATRAAIKRFQADKGIAESGYIDRLTAARLLTN